MMMLPLRATVVLSLVSAVAAFSPPRAAARGMQMQARPTLQPLRVTQLTDAEKKEQYWSGDWVCADCGYIYDKRLFGGRYFEEQTFGFKCPQCSGPRRRYAKMVGDTVGVTLDGGDGPILFWSGLGFIVTCIFGVWATYDFPGLP